MSVVPDSPRHPSGRATPHLVLIGVQVLFASFPVAGKWAFPAFDPMAIAAWRVLVGAGFLLTLAHLVHGRGLWLPCADLLRIIPLAVLGVALNQVLFINGLERTTAVNAGLLMGVIPVATHGFALLLRQERPSAMRIAGLVVALGGTAQLFLFRGVDLRPEHLVGNAMIVANAISYGLYLVLSRPLVSRQPPLVVLAWTFSFAVPLVCLVAMDVPWGPRSGATGPILALGWILIAPTILGYTGNVWALSRLPASITAFYVYLQPVLGSLFGIWLLEEHFGIREALCALLVGIGIALVNRRTERTPPIKWGGEPGRNQD